MNVIAALFLIANPANNPNVPQQGNGWANYGTMKWHSSVQ